MRKILCLVTILGLVSTAGAQQSLTFEPPTYSPGLVVGQDGWTCCVVGSDSSGFAVDSTVFSPMGSSTQSLKITGVNSGNRVARPWPVAVNSGVWRIGYDWRYSGNDGVTTNGNMFMATPMYRNDNNQIMQPYMQDGDGGGTGGAAIGAFTCTGPLQAGGFVGRSIGLPGTLAKNNWYRIEMVFDFSQKIILDLNIYDISSGSKVLLANNPGTYWFNYVGGAYVAQFDKLGVRLDSSNPAVSWWIDNYTIESTPLPAPIIGATLLYANANVPFNQAMFLSNPQPVTWSLNSGPAGAVIDPNTGVISGWTPTTVGSTANFSITATNTYGTAATKNFTVTVIGQYELLNIPFDNQIDTGGGPAIVQDAGHTIEFRDPELPQDTDRFMRYKFLPGAGANNYWHVNIYPQRAGYGSMNLSSCASRMTAKFRWYRDSGNYADSAVILAMYSSNGGKRDFGYIYPSRTSNTPQIGEFHPDWKTITVWTSNAALEGYTDSGSFNPADVTRIELWATDWSGTGLDFCDFNNLTVTNEPLVPDVNPVTPNLVTAFVGSPYTFQPSLVQCTPVTWSKTAGPGSIDPNTGLLSGWTPTPGELGNVVNFSVTATNSLGSDTESWQVIVKPVPVADSGIAQPWGTVHANIGGTQSSNAASMIMSNEWANGAAVDWTFDATAAGLNRPFDRVSSITFDEAGNLYWKTTDANGYVASVTPTGTLRWIGNVNGTNAAIGSGDKSSPVVGDQGDNGRVYVLTDTGAAAFAKSNGDRIWNTDLAGTNFAGTADVLTPVLYGGKLYVLGAGTPTKKLYQLNSTTGAVEWSTDVANCLASNGGQMTLVPNAFGAGVHGLYYNADGGNGANPEMYAIAVNTGTNSATLQWSAQGGKVSRSHVIYVAASQRVCTHTWNDYGASMYSWNLDGSLPASTINPGNAWHGYEDFGAVDFDGNDILAGGFDGRVARYLDVAAPGVLAPPSTVVFDSAGFEAYAPGSILGQDGWAENTDGGYAPVEIVSDPTGGGHGQVMKLDPPGTGPGWQGVVRALGTTSGSAVTMEWDQWRADLNDNFWVADSASYDGWWAMGWDQTGGLFVIGNGGASVPMTAGVWQHVKYTFDPGQSAVTLEIDGVTAKSTTTDIHISGLDLEVEPTAAGGEGGPMYIDNIVVKQGPASSPPPFAGSGYYQIADPSDAGENRGVGGLYQDQNGKSIYVAGTNSKLLVAFNVTDSPMYTAAPPQPQQDSVFEFDTGSGANPAGGPLLGPTVGGARQRIYYFDGSSGTLIALTPTRYAAGDFDKDGYVDRDDFILFLPCALGAEVPQTDPNCALMDIDGDDDVDADDFGIYQQCFNGAVLADVDCYP